MSQLYIRIESSRDRKVISFNRNQTIEHIKLQIQAKTGIPVDKQRVFLKWKILKDDCLITDYNIQNGDTLLVKYAYSSRDRTNDHPQKSPKVRRNRKKSKDTKNNKKDNIQNVVAVHVTTKPGGRARALGARVKSKTNESLVQSYSKHRSQLQSSACAQKSRKYNRKPIQKQSHRKKKAIQNRANVYRVKIEIDEYPSKKLVFECNDATTPHTIKRWIERKEGIPIQHQTLVGYYSQHQVCNDILRSWIALENKRTLTNHNLARLDDDECTQRLKLYIEHVTIRVATPHGDDWTVNVTGLDTIQALKTQIHTKYAMAVSRQYLSLHDQPLNNHQTIYSYQITSNTTFTLTSRLFQQYKTEHDAKTDESKREICNRSAELLTQHLPTLNETLEEMKDKVRNVKTTASLDALTPNLQSVLSAQITAVSKHLDVRQYDHIRNSLDVKLDQYLQHEMYFIQQDEKEIECQLTQMNENIESLQHKHKELMRLKQTKEAILNRCYKRYQELYQPIRDQRIAAVDAQVTELNQTRQDADKAIGEIDAQSTVNKMIDAQREKFEKQFERWDASDTMAWIKLIENGHFDIKRFEKNTNALDEMKIDGHKVHELNNSLFLEHVAGLEQKDQSILRRHISRIVSSKMESDSESANNICCICTINVVNTVTIPCGHCYLCTKCSRSCSQRMRTCSICRTRIRQIIPIFMSGF
eukprot:487903_1